METAISRCGHLKIMEKKMETAIIKRLYPNLRRVSALAALGSIGTKS